MNCSNKHILSLLCLLFLSLAGFSQKNENANWNLKQANYEFRMKKLSLDIQNTNNYNLKAKSDFSYSKSSLKKSMKFRKIDLQDELIGIIAFNAVTAAVIGGGYATGSIDKFPVVLVGIDALVSGALAWKMLGNSPFK